MDRLRVGEKHLSPSGPRYRDVPQPQLVNDISDKSVLQGLDFGLGLREFIRRALRGMSIEGCLRDWSLFSRCGV